MALNSSRSNASAILPVLAGMAGWRFWLIACTLTYYLVFALWPTLFALYGLDHSMGWFLDSYAILASNDAAAAGWNPWTINPYDPLGRPHVYSHWWLKLSGLGFTREDNFLLGGLFVAGFFAAAFWWLRARSKLELAWFLAVLLSPVILFGVERGNNDLFICALLMPVAGMITHPRAWVRWLALTPLLIATALKFYPAVGMVVLLAAPTRKEAWTRGLVAAAVVVVIILDARSDFAVLNNIIPRPRGLMTTGANRMFLNVGFTHAVSTYCSLILTVLALALIRPWRLFTGWSVAPEDRTIWMGFVLGATLLVGCFFAGSSYSYRFVFAVMMAPMLWRLMSDQMTSKPVRRLAIATSVLLLLMMWMDAVLSYVATQMLAGQPDEKLLEWSYRLAFYGTPVEWAFYICLLSFVTCFLADIAKALGFPLSR